MEETSRKTFPSHPRCLFGRRAFASSLATAAQVAWARAQRLAKAPIATHDVTWSESRVWFANPRWTSKPFVFARREREPSFYQGLFRPWLRSVLRGGIAYPWDFGPRITVTAPETMDTHPRLLVSGYCASDRPRSRTAVCTRETSLYFCLVFRRVVLLLALPHRKSDGGDLPGDRQLREGRLRARGESAARSPGAGARSGAA